MSTKIESSQREDLASSLVEIARECCLASMLVAYPDAELEETLRELDALADHAGAANLRVLACEGRFDDARSRYIELFDRGGKRASLYETEHGHLRGMGKGRDLADIAGFYAAFGFKIDSGAVHELVDHLAVELEFYGLLALKQHHLAGDEEGSAVVLDARRKFLQDHLGRFCGAVERHPAVAEDALYGPVVRWVAALIAGECARVGARPEQLDFQGDPEAQDEMKCGAVHLPVMP